MLNFFKKTPLKVDAIAYCRKLAEGAKIEVVLEQGNYSGFVIFIDVDNDLLAAHFRYPEAISGFVSIIENRIATREFTDESLKLFDMQHMREISGWKPKLDVIRAVFGKNKTPIFNWMGK